MRQIKTKKESNEFRFISTYESHAKIVQKAIKKSWYLLQGDKKYGKLFSKIPQFVYKKGRIGNLLVRSNIRAKGNIDKRLKMTEKRGTFRAIIVKIVILSLRGQS